jgi:hypothetical protein
MELKAMRDVIDKNGYKVFTKDHAYSVIMDKGNVLAVYCDLNAMYNVRKEELSNIFYSEGLK